MVHRFIRKPTRTKYVRRRKALITPHKIHIIKEEEKAVDEKPVESEPLVQDNNNIKSDEEMKVSTENLEQVEDLLNNVEGKQIPKRKTKVEKKDKGLIERTENSTILLTEDNKMLLND